MDRVHQDKLVKAYSKFRKIKKSKADLLRFFRALMPDIIYHTTKLEGEPVTRKMVSSLFK